MTNPEITSGRDDVHQPEAIQLRQILRNRYGIALLGLLVVLLLSAVIIRFLPKRYQAVVIFKDRQACLTEAHAGKSVTSHVPGSGGQSEGFVPSPSETLASDEVIGKLVRELDLATRFKLPEGPALIERVRGMIQIKPIRGTDAVRIIVTDVDQQRATDIARGIDKAYRVAQQPRANQLYFHACEVLDNQLKKQEEKLQAARMKMEEAMEKAVFVDISRSADRHKELEDEIITGKARGMMKNQSKFYELVLDLETLRAEIKGLEGFEGDMLVRRAVMLGIEDEIIQNQGPKFQELSLAEEQAELMGIGPNHPERKKTRGEMAALREPLVRAAEDLRRTLGGKLAMSEKQLVEEVLTSAANNSDFQLRSIHFADFKTALQDYEDQKDILAALRTESEMQLSEQHLPRFQLLFLEEPPSQPFLNPSHAHQLRGVLAGLILGGGLVFFAARNLAAKAMP